MRMLSWIPPSTLWRPRPWTWQTWVFSRRCTCCRQVPLNFRGNPHWARCICRKTRDLWFYEPRFNAGFGRARRWAGLRLAVAVVASASSLNDSDCSMPKRLMSTKNSIVNYSSSFTVAGCHFIPAWLSMTAIAASDRDSGLDAHSCHCCCRKYSWLCLVLCAKV